MIIKKGALERPNYLINRESKERTNLSKTIDLTTFYDVYFNTNSSEWILKPNLGNKDVSKIEWLQKALKLGVIFQAEECLFLSHVLTKADSFRLYSLDSCSIVSTSGIDLTKALIIWESLLNAITLMEKGGSHGK